MSPESGTRWETFGIFGKMDWQASAWAMKCSCHSSGYSAIGSVLLLLHWRQVTYSKSRSLSTRSSLRHRPRLPLPVSKLDTATLAHTLIWQWQSHDMTRVPGLATSPLLPRSNNDSTFKTHCDGPGVYHLLYPLRTVGYTMRDIRYKWNEGPNSVGVSSEVSLPQFKVLGHRQRAMEISLTTGTWVWEELVSKWKS